MVKTNAEFRGDLAVKYRGKLREVDGTLNLLAELGFSKEEIKPIRERLISNFQSKLQKEEGYGVARDTHRAELKAKGSVIKAEDEKERLQREYEEKSEMLQREYEEKIHEADRNIVDKTKIYEDAQVAYRGKVEGKGLEDLKGDSRRILDFLKENYVKVWENVEMMGYKGKKVHIELPAVGDFKGYKFDYFVSNDYVTKSDFEKKKLFERKSKLEKKSCSIKDVSKLLKAMNRFMAELGCVADKDDFDYEKGLKGWEMRAFGSYARCYLDYTIILPSICFLSDKDKDNGSRAKLICCGDARCFIERASYYNSEASLFLRLSEFK